MCGKGGQCGRQELQRLLREAASVGEAGNGEVCTSCLYPYPPWFCRQRLEAELASTTASLEERQHAASLLAAQQAELQVGDTVDRRMGGAVRLHEPSHMVDTPGGTHRGGASETGHSLPLALHPQAYAAEVEQEQAERLALEQRIRTMESKVGWGRRCLDTWCM